MEMSAKHLDSKIVFNVNTQKVVIHCYNSTQNIMVNGKMYLEFVSQYLQPLLVEKIEESKPKIAEYGRTVISSLGPKRPVRASRSVRSVRSVIHQPLFKCKRCEAVLKKSLDRHVTPVHEGKKPSNVKLNAHTRYVCN